MDIKKITEIVNETMIDSDTKRLMIINVIAEDIEAINDVLEILGRERRQRKEMISDMNNLLSKADAALDAPKLNKDGFIQSEVKELYTKWSSVIKHVWKKYD